MRKLLQHMMQSVAQRASRSKTWHMQQVQPEPEYPPDDGPLTSEQIEQLKTSARTKYA